MRASQRHPSLEPPQDVSVDRAFAPSVPFYRFLYNSVGANHCWVDRNRLPDDELRRIVQDECVEIHCLFVKDRVAGYSELDRRQPGEIELAYFGLFPEFIGQGLGKFFLGWTVDLAWSYQPERVWLHTCDLDHPAALPTYLQAGFSIYDEKPIEQVIAYDGVP
jgi:GNAT superfamily N-acetyltransferase